MRTSKKEYFKKTALCLAISTVISSPSVAFAEEVEAKIEGIERINVTASRRVSSIQ